MKPGQDDLMDQDVDQDQNRTELSKLEIELCKQNFGFYDKNKVGSVERFELPMLLNGI
jgi:Ca2+-binding EF-hand superfamily protein